ncbi:hypothetical protein [Streptomyces goshikiensis]|uniref:hypothetical protein n=1 Tax=Streptomyces goshikiensis TaxID=1942 RepID=UPI0036AFC449
MSSPAEISDRRTRVRQLAQTGASSRQIADQLGVGKDTVLRDLRQQDAAPQSQRDRLARRVAQAEEAVRQACAAAQGVTDARPAYAFTDDETAERWRRTLRTAAAQLDAAVGAFADYYPCATD